MQDVVPQGYAHAGLEEGVRVNGAVMEYFIYEGKISDLGVVPWDIVNDLIRQGMRRVIFSDERIVGTADMGAVEQDLLQKGKQDAEKLSVHLSIAFHAQTLDRGVHEGKPILGETAETPRAIRALVEQDSYDIRQLLVFGNGSGSELEV